LKLARGHFAYECSEPQLNEPKRILSRPLCTMSAKQVQSFETPPVEYALPEIEAGLSFEQWL
jgi:hypothetical protein